VDSRNRRHQLLFIQLLLAGLLCIGAPSAEAACSKAQVLKLYENNVSVEKIADRCEMSIEAIEAIVEPDEPEVTTPPAQAMCCDAYGYSRCPIVAGSTEIGTTCFCPGQGYGVICR